MKKYELLSQAIDLSYADKTKEAWDMVHEADKLADAKDTIYNNLRDATCTLITANRRKAVKENE